MNTYKTEFEIMIGTRAGSNWRQVYFVRDYDVKLPHTIIYETLLEPNKLVVGDSFYFDNPIISIPFNVANIIEHWHSENKQYYLINVPYFPFELEDKKEFENKQALAEEKNRYLELEYEKYDKITEHKREEINTLKERKILKALEDKKALKTLEDKNAKLLSWIPLAFFVIWFLINVTAFTIFQTKLDVIITILGFELLLSLFGIAIFSCSSDE